MLYFSVILLYRSADILLYLYSVILFYYMHYFPVLLPYCYSVILHCLMQNFSVLASHCLVSILLYIFCSTVLLLSSPFFRECWIRRVSSTRRSFWTANAPPVCQIFYSLSLSLLHFYSLLLSLDLSAIVHVQRECLHCVYAVHFHCLLWVLHGERLFPFGLPLARIDNGIDCSSPASAPRSANNPLGINIFIFRQSKRRRQRRPAQTLSLRLSHSISSVSNERSHCTVWALLKNLPAIVFK